VELKNNKNGWGRTLVEDGVPQQKLNLKISRFLEKKISFNVNNF
jgi:hypothetical protein